MINGFYYLEGYLSNTSNIQIRKILRELYLLYFYMDQYKLESKKGEGTFSEVVMAESLRDHKYVAIKCMKKKYENIQRVTRLKEIQALKLLTPHQHIVKLIEILYDQPTGKLALVFQLMDMNLYECLVQNRNLKVHKKKFYMYQLLKAIQYIHSKGIFHRDIKPENVLITGDLIKLADFGSCKGIYSKPPYTEYISTRWYRAPQCLMTDGYYNYKMDIWGFGCVLFQMMAQYPLFNGKSQLDQIHKINKVLGTPKPQLLQYFKSHASHMSQNQFNFPPKKGTGFERLLPNAPRELIDLLHRLLAYDPNDRITAKQALKHQYFAEFHEYDNNQGARFRSTVFGLPMSHSESKSIKNQETPQKRGTIKKQGNKKIEQDISTLPPIHQLRLDVKFNLYGSTAKTHDNVFKKTLNSIAKKKDEHYMITGKKFH